MKRNAIGVILVVLAFFTIIASSQVSDEQNLITNPMRQDLIISGIPGWNHASWGNNDPSFPANVTDPRVGNVSLGIEIKNYTSGDAKWYPDLVQVIPGHKYEVMCEYKADYPICLYMGYSKTGYDVEFTDASVTKKLPARNTWQLYGEIITIPAGYYWATEIPTLPDPDSKMRRGKIMHLYTKNYVIKMVGNDTTWPPDLPIPDSITL